ncbi:PriCT-2 domain-containing protein [Thiomicrorhabdus xiamenensis]|uniref:PriCT-2 domain-containing protein n=1 Tax=Thiomicrorhabdus xiamenensis TaxID=2739063 RepID=A0A7D4NP15_9GAMM|nr:PriCT-2 domain-containing protein [Thiomicrorhabdus xiamenensis]QKI89213.1 PriCT-2 domain-containing protein [Thiomicrorhabdus xiamenensis]
MNKQHQDIDLSILEQMLNYISAEQAREDWARLLMAAKSEFGEDAKEVMQAWSATASNYDKNAFISTWRSIRASGGVTIGSLIHEAIENGYKFAPMNEADKKRLKAEQRKRANQRKQAEQQEAQEREQGYLAAQSKAKDLVQRAMIANPRNEYFVQKGVTDMLHGLNLPLQLGRAVMVPVYRFNTQPKAHPKDTDLRTALKLVSVQFINPDSDKRFLKGSQKTGSFFVLRFHPDSASIVVCEGIATGITYAAHYDTQSAIVVAFDAANLKPVARAFKIRYPVSRLIIAADNDRFNKDGTPAKVNKGIVYGQKAAKAVDGAIVWPEFAPHESGSDFNDRYLLDTSPMQNTGVNYE